MAKESLGKPANFDPEQLQALKRELRAYNARMEKLDPSWNQTKLGAALGVKQQVAGGHLAKETGGMQNRTALAVAKLAGFETLDEFFAAHLRSSVSADTVNADRDLAIRLARRTGVSDRAIENVLTRYASTAFDNRKSKWWLSKFIAEDDDLDLLPEGPPPPAESVAVPTPTQRSVTTARRRRVG